MSNIELDDDSRKGSNFGLVHCSQSKRSEEFKKRDMCTMEVHAEIGGMHADWSISKHTPNAPLS